MADTTKDMVGIEEPIPMINKQIEQEPPQNDFEISQKKADTAEQLISTNNDIDMPLLDGQEEPLVSNQTTAINTTGINEKQTEPQVTLELESSTPTIAPPLPPQEEQITNESNPVNLEMEIGSSVTEERDVLDAQQTESPIIADSDAPVDINSGSLTSTPPDETSVVSEPNNASFTDTTTSGISGLSSADTSSQIEEQTEQAVNDIPHEESTITETTVDDSAMDVSIESGSDVHLEYSEDVSVEKDITTVSPEEKSTQEVQDAVCTITEEETIEEAILEEVSEKEFEQSINANMNSGGDQESAIEAENAVAHIIPSEEDVKENQEGLENVDDVREEMEEVQYQVVVNEDEVDNLTVVNGVDTLVEAQNEVVDQNNVEEAIIGLPSDEMVEEVANAEVQILRDDEVVNAEQPEQVVILSNDQEQVVLMETAEQVDQVGAETETDSYEQIESMVQQIEEPKEQKLKAQKSETVKKEKEEPSNLEEDDEEDKSTNIPCHVMGRSVENPLVDPVRNGKVLLKPRLGVKIPYRNLTSQIVSKQEIAEEIMERSRQRQSNSEPPAGGDVFFAKKLTQRLAKKIVPTPYKSSSSSKSSTKSSSSSTSSSNKSNTTAASSGSSSQNPSQSKSQTAIPGKIKPKEEMPKSQEPPKKTSDSTTQPVKKTPTSGKIIDNSDLIALLEGDDVDFNIGRNDPPILPPQTKLEKRSADWEREIALKQLRDLHENKISPSSHTSNHHNQNPPILTKEPPLTQITHSESKEKARERERDRESKNIVDIEKGGDPQPRFSSSTPLKTYARKRKIEDLKPSSSSLAASSPSKKSAISIDSSKRPSEDKPPKRKEERSLSTHSSSSSSSSRKTAESPKRALSSNEKSSSSTKKPSTVQKVTSSSQHKQPAVILQKANLTQKSSSDQKSSTQKLKKPQEDQKTKKEDDLHKPKKSEDQKTKKTNEDQKTKKSIEDQKSKKVDQKPKKSVEPDVSKVKVEEPPAEADEQPPKVDTPPPAPINASLIGKNLSPNTYISKSSRIVKRKKIWDPDEVTPTAAKLIKSPKVVEYKSPEKAKTEAAPPKVVTKAVTPSPKPSTNNSLSPPKKTIVKKAKAKQKKKPKRLSEIDRLLMDEGAVNLLYAVKNTDGETTKKNKTRISIDRAQRELMNKTNEIKNDLLQINSTKDSSITLRKKEGATPKSSMSPVKDMKEQQIAMLPQAAVVLYRKKSKDSVSGSVHSPPASPYLHHGEASRIIRRHSSSSFSSDNSDNEQQEKKRSDSPKKKMKSEKQAKALTVADKEVLSVEMSKNFNKAASDDPKYSQFETCSVRRFDNLTQIILAPTASHGLTTLSTQVLTELVELLGILEKDKNCRVVVLSSSGSSFCQGINYKELTSDDKPTCQKIVEEYAINVKNFLTSLARFSKILVAGVHGHTIGLGVTMLPLFDMVLASDTAAFSTPYARLGCVAEGSALFTLPHVMHNALASELFFASRKLTAGEALKHGLVTRTLWPDKFQEELITVLKAVSGQSLQSMQAIKKQLRQELSSKVEALLKAETSILIQHWMSNECQNNFSSYSLENK